MITKASNLVRLRPLVGLMPGFIAEWGVLAISWAAIWWWFSSKYDSAYKPDDVEEDFARVNIP
jgi:hypothetical protein